jgi:hypothetical protein
MRGRSLVNMSAIWCLDGTWRTRAGLTMYYLFPNKMYVHLNMLGALMLHMITWEINGTDIVTIHQSGLRDRKVELQEKVTYPARFKDHVLPFPLYSASALERERERERERVGWCRCIGNKLEKTIVIDAVARRETQSENYDWNRGAAALY